eukprot:gnl/Dysnectes_brevis/2303_a2711_1303.p1 GENE.gnl/Dysnectes_brevis/2303_a2711_1303~~gnl/Dysnectes_brevis/2303_a2711_1303.p1  ORF type:complete len:348 (+),score=36.76 gnl/Dysnectes_brevis/2303_a2711_1303:67-1110(+)
MTKRMTGVKPSLSKSSAQHFSEYFDGKLPSDNLCLQVISLLPYLESSPSEISLPTEYLLQLTDGLHNVYFRSPASKVKSLRIGHILQLTEVQKGHAPCLLSRFEVVGTATPHGRSRNLPGNQLLASPCPYSKHKTPRVTVGMRTPSQHIHSQKQIKTNLSVRFTTPRPAALQALPASPTLSSPPSKPKPSLTKPPASLTKLIDTAGLQHTLAMQQAARHMGEAAVLQRVHHFGQSLAAVMVSGLSTCVSDYVQLRQRMLTCVEPSTAIGAKFPTEFQAGASSSVSNMMRTSLLREGDVWLSKQELQSLSIEDLQRIPVTELKLGEREQVALKSRIRQTLVKKLAPSK